MDSLIKPAIYWCWAMYAGYRQLKYAKVDSPETKKQIQLLKLKHEIVIRKFLYTILFSLSLSLPLSLSLSLSLARSFSLSLSLSLNPFYYIQ